MEKLEREAPEAESGAEDMLMSVDGAFVALTTGEWKEVKTSQLSYFSRSYPAREFERYALVETHQRGIEKAKRVVAVNDGAEWIQGFIAYHCPDAIRVIDFSHAQSYVAVAGKAGLGEGTEAFQSWFAQVSHQLKHETPQTVLVSLQSLRYQAPLSKQSEAMEIIDNSLNYLSKRQTMLRYAEFSAHGLPLGSGSVESSHKLVLQSRMKQAGMRWAPGHVNPMLTLRNFVVNDRWDEEWQETVAYERKQRRSQRRLRKAALTQVITPTAVSVSSPLPLPETDVPSAPANLKEQLPKTKTPWRPPADHPWRRPFLNSRLSAYR
ncbi:MAG TPA: hypothetical protein EYP10_00780, partial [Armatimonadetes bacterium]|nr:hypothetical protein [Armatimonadota bacterium]